MEHDLHVIIHRTQPSGWILPVTLGWIVFLSAAAHIALHRSAHHLRTMRIVQESMKLEDKLVDEIASNIHEGTEPHCIERTEQGALFTAAWKECRSTGRPFRSTTRAAEGAYLFDLSIFDSALPCPGDLTPSYETSLQGSASHEVCRVLDLRSDTTFVLSQDLVTSSATIDQNSDKETPLLATPGRMEIKDLYIQSSAAVVLAGGDLHITSLTSASPSKTKITLISLSGGVRVDSVSDQISLLVLARAEIATPVTPFLPPFPLPPLRSSETIALGPVDR